MSVGERPSVEAEQSEEKDDWRTSSRLQVQLIWWSVHVAHWQGLAKLSALAGRIIYPGRGHSRNCRRGLNARWHVGKAPTNPSHTQFTQLCQQRGEICKSFCILTNHLISNKYRVQLCTPKKECNSYCYQFDRIWIKSGLSYLQFFM